MAKDKVVEEKKAFKVSVTFDGSKTATINRPGMPFIVDENDTAVQWLSQRYKEDEIEVVGEKPLSSWSFYFPKPQEEVPAETPLVEAIEKAIA